MGQSNSPSENYLFLNVIINFVIVNQKLTGSALHIEKNQTIAKTKTLISCAIIAQLICDFVFAYAYCWFSDAPAQLQRKADPLERQISKIQNSRFAFIEYEADIKLFILVGWGRSLSSVAWPTGV